MIDATCNGTKNVSSLEAIRIKVLSVSFGLVRVELVGRFVAGTSIKTVHNTVKSSCDCFKVRSIVLNMAGVSELDAAGIGALVACYRSAELAGATLTLEDVPPRAQRVLALCRLDRMFGLVPTTVPNEP